MNKREPIDILAVETSCDETAAAVIRNGTGIRSNVVLSQMKSHKRFGGVVPEVASRHHAEAITQVMEQALEEAGSTFSDLSAVAVTEGPGLVGALLVGVNAAKATAYAKGLPLIGVHHIAGHIQATRLEEEWEYPALALVVSGGHTELVLIQEEGEYELLGQTRDDAVGEAYDKVARTLGLPYPGGPELDKLAEKGVPDVPLPVAWLEEGSYDFSFSGLKSAVMNTLHNARQRGEELAPEDVAASFQQSVITVLTEKTACAAEAFGVKQVMVVGGVAANSGLRTAMEEKFKDSGIKLQIPPLHLCTDNAAMIGAAAYINWKKGNFSGMDLNGVPGLPLHT
ncbi:tRNA (adenosine(37)-N6)-threonylcarbamoyltransferase complex transferase subunit TsaD [Marinococcus sp. PL1-022]|uniref:tRNA (adenosine(37)-N6)-threonylcarbamoyltransferase complex transferase subunit TsaD n=1 Tax=Marinococcus sp. PL1-022 TaxID=3095363 RepID=UPI0029C4D5E6|nr:tRNA (adenosine(37)-N6)-threonylcarbamoyltransferase complex transferase subunit TsaD [Marinococcus sp. PL1-022]MDX6153724.1 tRNA (adenosine(37)-N6)-threonylcarbamoyltransferase complex transferase subunit TsaD [Marinococcus sp. PL1-022]